MKGVILAGGTGSRLFPCTKVTNKHLLPVFNKPMIYYPLYSMKEAGITEVLIISGPEHAGHFLQLLGSGESLGLKISYALQEKPGGIGQALGLAKSFVGDDKMVVLLGDNIFENNLKPFVDEFSKKENGAMVLLKKVKNPSAYGVAVMEGEKIKLFIEKPSAFISDLAVVGLYMYDNTVFDVVKNLKPSARGEIEIQDVNNYYLSESNIYFHEIKSFWGDCGESFEVLLDVQNYVKGSILADIDANLTIIDRSKQENLKVDSRQSSILESKN